MSATDDPAEVVLVEWAKQGNSEAFRQLLMQYESALRAYCRSQSPPGDLDDVIEEVRVAAWKGLPKLQGHFPAWLFGIATHKCADARRRRARSKDKTLVGSNEHEQTELQQIADPNARGSSLIRDRERSLILRTAISKLDDLDRRIIELRLDGMKGEQLLNSINLEFGLKITSGSLARRESRIAKHLESILGDAGLDASDVRSHRPTYGSYTESFHA